MKQRIDDSVEAVVEVEGAVGSARRLDVHI